MQTGCTPSQDNTDINNMAWLQGFDHEPDTNKSAGLITARVPGSVEINNVDGGGGGGECEN